MRITVLTVPDCPNDPLAQERIAAALEGRAAEVELVEVRDEAEAARWGMSGSPTVLLDGVDPFAPAAAAPSVSCRLYRDADGTVSGAPSVAALRQALAGADIAQPVAVGDCCPSEGFAVVGRGGGGGHRRGGDCVRCTRPSCGTLPPPGSHRSLTSWKQPPLQPAGRPGRCWRNCSARTS
ncbi:hypothetical protein ACFYXP_29520 [Streptomyces sp. NPDC002466]|uniref:hypothetical protein n=1 Tax=Streptomyces sp. NPDC002466 TaxID=3364646 RepID=UPI00368C79D5